jgi:dihydrofolate reductase
MIISMIAAVAENGVIGKDNDLVWNLPDDMRYFVEKTRGRHVIMGRKNFESIPEKFRPLPNRPNIILSRNTAYHADGCTTVDNLSAALNIAKESEEYEAFIIGGAQIYQMGLEYADRMYITEVKGSFEGDTFFPEFDKSIWKETSRISHEKDERHDFAFDFVTYEKV